MPRLENWEVISLIGRDSYKAPEQQALHLQGSVYGHPNFTDGQIIYTSRIVKADGRQVQTRNTLYDLGKVSPKYLEWYRKHGPGECDLESDSPFESVGDIQ